MGNLEALTFTYTRKRLRDVTIRNVQSRDTDIDIDKKKTLEIVQSCMDNPQTLTLTYKRKRR